MDYFTKCRGALVRLEGPPRRRRILEVILWALLLGTLAITIAACASTPRPCPRLSSLVACFVA